MLEWLCGHFDSSICKTPPTHMPCFGATHLVPSTMDGHNATGMTAVAPTPTRKLVVVAFTVLVHWCCCSFHSCVLLCFRPHPQCTLSHYSLPMASHGSHVPVGAPPLPVSHRSGCLVSPSQFMVPLPLLVCDRYSCCPGYCTV